MARGAGWLLLLAALAGPGCQLVTEPLAGHEPRPLMVTGRSPDHMAYGNAENAARATVGSEVVLLPQWRIQDMAAFTAGPDSTRQTVEFTCRLDMGGYWYLYDCRSLAEPGDTAAAWPRAGADFTRVMFPEIDRVPAREYVERGRPLEMALPDDPTWRQVDVNLRRMLDALLAGDAATASHYLGPDAYRAAYYELLSPATLAELKSYHVIGYGVGERGQLLCEVALRRIVAGTVMTQLVRCEAGMTERGPLVLRIDFFQPYAGVGLPA